MALERTDAKAEAIEAYRTTVRMQPDDRRAVREARNGVATPAR